MPHIHSARRMPAVTAALVLLLTCLGLAACGNSSKSSTTGTSAAASTSTSSSGTSAPGSASTTPGGRGKGAFGKRFAAIRECLAKNGVTLPKRPAGGGSPQRRGGAGGFLGGGAGAGGPQLPKGVTRAQYEAALKKCGGGSFAAGGAGGARFKSPVFKAALAKFASCLRENGVKVPAPNTSGKGPIFNTKGINTASAQFKAAESKCSSALRGAFGRGAGGPGPRGAGAGGPPAGGGTQPPA
jgi:hypothetical protein